MTGQDIGAELPSIIGDLWLNSRVLADVTELCDLYGHRFAGSESERRALPFIVERFRAYGFENVRAEPCRYTSWKRGSCSFEVLSPYRRAFPAVTLVQLLVAAANAPTQPGPKLARADMFSRLEAAGHKQELADQGRWHPETVLGF